MRDSDLGKKLQNTVTQIERIKLNDSSFGPTRQALAVLNTNLNEEDMNKLGFKDNARIITNFRMLMTHCKESENFKPSSETGRSWLWDQSELASINGILYYLYLALKARNDQIAGKSDSASPSAR